MRNVRWLRAVLVAAGVLLTTRAAMGSPILWSNHYRLGDADPGAAPGNVGNPTTTDSGGQPADLARAGVPFYSADTPPWAMGSKLSMWFSNNPLLDGAGGMPSWYGRSGPLSTDQLGYGLETWAKADTLSPPDPSGYAVIAYNGDPAGAGFGFLQYGGDYVVRLGKTEKVLSPASTTAWTHLAFVHEADTDTLYVNGLSVGTFDAGLTFPAAGAFMLGGNPLSTANPALFRGWIDETRFFWYNPLAMGAPGPGDFLLRVPEPATLVVLAGAGLLAIRRRSR